MAVKLSVTRTGTRRGGTRGGFGCGEGRGGVLTAPFICLGQRAEGARQS
jgi:hypothetical protein